MLTIAERVDAGIKFLDEHGPEKWREKIVLKQLNMRSICDCVLGFVYADCKMEEHHKCNDKQPGYWKAQAYLNMDAITCQQLGFDASSSEELGSNAYYSDKRNDYVALQEEWIRRLTEVKEVA